jgi:hypothetical protein
MSEVIEAEIKLKRITIKTETGSKWFDEPKKLLVWVQQQYQLILQKLLRIITTHPVKNDQDLPHVSPTQLVDMINRLSPKS